MSRYDPVKVDPLVIQPVEVGLNLVETLVALLGLGRVGVLALAARLGFGFEIARLVCFVENVRSLRL